MKYLLGPIQSRRLGLSLGINLFPDKICSMDCIYCECGRTKKLTTERKEYVPSEEVIAELAEYLKTGPELDYLTFSGSGEPLLHLGIKKIISFLKSNYPQYKVALLTNSLAFLNPELIDEVLAVDLIVPSLDAARQESFEKINRPVAGISLQGVIDGLFNLRQKYQGPIWLEIFIVSGFNDTEAELKKFKEIIARINPDKVQLNSLSRPGTEKWLKKASLENLNRIAEFLGEKVEII